MPDLNSTGLVEDLLAARYQLPEIQLTRLPIGQGTINYQGAVAGRRLFVKHYPADVDLDAEADAISLSRLAGQHGVPVAQVRPDTQGRIIARYHGVAVSVWEWVDGQVVIGGFTTGQQNAAGEALGRIHAAFADHPASGAPAPGLSGWLKPDLAALETTIDTLLGIIGSRTGNTGERDSFDDLAAATLTQRQQVLPRIQGLLDGLPDLTTQVVHGDYSAVNLLWDGDQLAAVVDFRPPSPWLVAFELGRIAFDPRTLATADWLTSALTLVEAYLRANPHAQAADVRCCARVALIQLLTSLYGVKDHYLKPGLLQDDLDKFWLLRHRGAQLLLNHLEETETLLSEAVKRTDPQR